MGALVQGDLISDSFMRACAMNELLQCGPTSGNLRRLFNLRGLFNWGRRKLNVY